MTDRELMQQAMNCINGMACGWYEGDASEISEALRERLAREERPCTCHPDDNPPIPCAKQYALAQCREAARQEQEPVAHSIVAGALFDFMGWLTSRRERLVLSSVDNAGPAADAIKEFAQMRSLSINDAQVQEWQEHLTITPQRREWVGLTGEEWIELGCRSVEQVRIGLAIEAKLKEKNA